MGVNGNTESKSRFLSFKKNSDKINIYSLEEIKDIIFKRDLLNQKHETDEIPSTIKYD